MYKVVSKNISSIKIGDTLVDFGDDATNFDECLNWDNSELLRFPTIRRQPYYSTIKNLFKDELTGEQMVTMKWSGDRETTFTIDKLNDNNGWGKVVIMAEKDILFFRLKQNVAE
ncbi:MAG TPA: hypothetical protein VNW06_08245 [Cytophagaceae bacterium]|jgi:hypothetical protein|nr:hypothetical protein [Cytophagaceae bacterium]